MREAAATEAQFAALADDLARAGDSMGLAALLDERHPAYAEQPSAAIARMRSWVLIALSRRPLPDSALPYVLEELDTSLDARLVASAAIALRACPQPSPALAAFLGTALINIRPHDEPVAFDRYGEYETAGPAATAVEELLRTVAWLGPAASSLAPQLQAWRMDRTVSTRLVPALEGALAALGPADEVRGSGEDCCLPWLRFRADVAASAGPMPSAVDSVVFEDQDGSSLTFRELFHGRPSVVAFFYTRCDNPLKCSLTVWKLARLQELLERRGIHERIGVAAITYDPAFDLPERMRIYGRNRGFRMGAGGRLLRSPAGMAALTDFFNLGVSFARSLVSRHRLEVFLLDRRGRIARSFTRVRWDEGEIADAAAAIAEDVDGWSREELRGAPAAASGLFGAALLAAVPKCPLCWNAYLSSIGLGVVSAGAPPGRMHAVAAALLFVHVVSVWWRSRRTRRFLGPMLSTAGAMALGAALAFGAWPAPAGVVLVALGAVVTASGRRHTAQIRTPATGAPPCRR